MQEIATASEVNGNQPWARYLEGDKILTKIGLGWVGIRIGMATPTFRQIGIGIGMAMPSFGTKSWGKLGFSSIFPAVFRSKTPGKVRLNLDFSRLAPTSLNFSRLTSTILRVRYGHSDFLTNRDRDRDGLLDLSCPYLMGIVILRTTK